MKKEYLIFPLITVFLLTGCGTATEGIVTESQEPSLPPLISVVTATPLPTNTPEVPSLATPSPAVTPTPANFKEIYLPHWWKEYLNEYGYYDDVPDELVEEYVSLLENRGFHAYVWKDDYKKTMYLVTDNVWITIKYPYHSGYTEESPRVGYQIEVNCQQHVSHIPKAKAAAMIEEIDTGEPRSLVAILDISPGNMGEDCGLEMFLCLFEDPQGNYYSSRYLVGEKSVAQEYMTLVRGLVYTKTEGALRDKAVLLQMGGPYGSDIRIRVYSSQDGIPVIEYEASFQKGWNLPALEMSLREHDGKIYLVSTERVYEGGGEHTHWWRDGEIREYEITVSDGKIRLDDPEANWQEIGSIDWYISPTR